MIIRSHRLMPFTPADQLVAREIYADAIDSQAAALYSAEQISAWMALAWLPGVFDRPLAEGSGWLSVENDQAEAFALRYPSDRLALLYCRGRAARRGHATGLLARLEAEAYQEGLRCLSTEASLLSQPLLSKCGWRVKAQESIAIGGVSFDRYRMEKVLQAGSNRGFDAS
ncbi:MAG: GNAT family N-acetyltransferase [Prochlorococcaceae cyanobacterium ETNP18_MAG_1]|nr:GNAT family N-acetyltransferase [Prochlorococcaceae cyanobacterium ETNP18_MAG_1]